MEFKSSRLFFVAFVLLGTFYIASASLGGGLIAGADNACSTMSSVGSFVTEITSKFLTFARIAGIRVPTEIKPNVDNIAFVLFEPCGRQQDVSIRNANNIRNNPHFNANRTTIVFMTGWFSKLEDAAPNSLGYAYMCRGGYNYLYVDPFIFTYLPYTKSASRTTEIGELVAAGLKDLGIQGDSIHLIGHSLGAHVAGSAARHFYKLTGQKVERVTGLDPARPCFKKPADYPPLKRGDATFVDIIHSNPGKFGTEEVIGDADFYAGYLNDVQTGCSDDKCSHSRAISYYLETVFDNNENSFMAAQCKEFSDVEKKSCNGPESPVGFATDKNSKGIYSFSVNGKSPFGFNAHKVNSNCAMCATSARSSWPKKIDML